MWGLRNEDVLNYKQVCYIATKGEPEHDEFYNEIQVFKKPEKFIFNIQPLTNRNTSEAMAFGELISRMKVATISKKEYLGKFKEFDLAYLDGQTPKGEKNFGDNANYRIYSVQPQNAIIKLYFLKIVKEEE